MNELRTWIMESEHKLGMIIALVCGLAITIMVVACTIAVTNEHARTYSTCLKYHSALECKDFAR